MALLCALFATTGHAQSYKLRSAVGTNLAAVEYWSSQLPFVDVMKSSSAWVSGDKDTWDNKQAIAVDADGWVRSLAPGQIARTLMLRAIGGNYPAGQYVVRYKGQGTLGFAGSVVVLARKPGEILLQVTPDAEGLLVNLEATSPGDYLRDIQVTLPGGVCEGDPFRHAASASQCRRQRFLAYADHARDILFNPVFLERLRAYSVLRFMDWMRTNNSQEGAWQERVLPSHRTWTTPKGVPVEVMVELANRLDAHPWFTLPHLADAAYARSFALAVKAGLERSLRVNVEHSNEVWNGLFSQARGMTPELHAQRSRMLGEVFKGVLGADRVMAILGAQAASPATAVRAIDSLKALHGAALGIDAIAIAPYFGLTPDPMEAEKFAAMTLDELFAHVRTVSLPGSAATMKAYRTLANAHGLRLVSYEGGQHLVGILGAENNERLTALFLAFNRDARIRQMYLDNLAAWKDAGGELFVHFTDAGRYDKWGSWGALEYISQPRAAAPKFDALHSFIERNPVWWAR